MQPKLNADKYFSNKRSSATPRPNERIDVLLLEIFSLPNLKFECFDIPPFKP